MKQQFFEFDNESPEQSSPVTETEVDVKATPASVEKVEPKKPHIFTITEITKNVRAILEANYADVWLAGEVSNFRNPGSGHFYFSLKDEKAQLAAVMFRGANQKLAFKITDGMELVCHGRMTVYEARGNYQVVIDYCEPKGVGALQLAFEQLKKKLSAEGLFDKKHKKPIPFLPKRIGIVTSGTGAAVRDIINVATRRFPGIQLLVVPVRVQGEGSAQEVAAAINLLNQRNDVDVMIVGRGGGSLEDLWAFNEEVVAQAIFKSQIPVVSAVGHEIDFTIADFVADLRAPTPSAAAEIVVPNQADLLATLRNFHQRLEQAIIKDFPQRMQLVDGYRERLRYAWNVAWERRSDYLQRLISNLNHLSPLHVMAKGFSVVTRAGATVPLTAAGELSKGDAVDIRFYDGSAEAIIESISTKLGD